jgi:hypothetical protein
MKFLCAVRHCRYVAVSGLGDEGEFLVCALHDAPQTLGILEQLMAPASYWGDDGRPIVLPCGELRESDFEPSEAPADAICASDDPRLAEIPDGPSKMTHPNFDLTAEL